MNQMADVLKLSAPRAIAKFAIPTILSQLVTLIHNLADTFFVGHTNDPAQVAALTLSFPLFMMIIMASLGGMRSGGIPLTLVFVFLFYIGGEIYNGIALSDNVSQLTHIIGGVCGAVIGILIRSRRK